MNRTEEQKQLVQLAKVKEQIEKLTNRPVVSNDLGYLERRLEDLKTRKRSGETVRRSPSPSSNFSVSMPEDSRGAMVELTEREGLGVSKLIRRALGEYAQRHGYSKQAAVLLGED